MENKPDPGALSGTATLCRGLIPVCTVRYAITVAYPTARILPFRGTTHRRRQTFIMQGVLQFTAADAEHTAELWADRDLELATDDGRRFACLLLKSATTDNLMWECGLNPCRPPKTSGGG